MTVLQEKKRFCGLFLGKCLKGQPCKMLAHWVWMGWVNVLHCSPYSACFKIVVEWQNNGNNTTVFWVQLNKTCTLSRVSLRRRGALTPQRVNPGWAGLIRGPPNQDNSLTDQGNFTPHRASLSPIKLRESMRCDRGYDICPLKQVLHMLRPWFPGIIWTSAHQWQVENGFLFLPCLHAQPLLPLLKCHCLDARVVLPAFHFLPVSQGSRVSSCVGFWVLARVKPSLQPATQQ